MHQADTSGADGYLLFDSVKPWQNVMKCCLSAKRVNNMPYITKIHPFYINTFALRVSP